MCAYEIIIYTKDHLRIPHGLRFMVLRRFPSNIFLLKNRNGILAPPFLLILSVAYMIFKTTLDGDAGILGLMVANSIFKLGFA